VDLPVSDARLLVDVLPEAGGPVRVTGEEVAHAQARRLSPGDPVILVDGSGREAVGRLTRVARNGLDVEIESVRLAPPDPLPPLILCVAAVRAERLAWIAEKATELGAARLTLVSTERTQRFRASEALLPRLSRVVREAAKQSERARWPAITGPVPLSELLVAEGSGNRLILDSSGEAFPPELPLEPTVLLVGPEGGWCDAELADALAAGWVATSLAAGKLRAETAAVAALALARHALAAGRR
jgi:16S rRNA (uracil1498-N3)-methyltransferase